MFLQASHTVTDDSLPMILNSCKNNWCGRLAMCQRQFYKQISQ